MNKKKSFIFYYDWWDIFEPLPKEQRGELITAIFDYVKNGTEPEYEELALRISFNVIRNALNRDGEKYEKTCLKNSENAKKRWQKNTKLCDRIKSDANYADNENDTDNVNVNDTDNDNVNVKDSDNNSSSFSSKTVGEYSDDFILFWKEYPKKVGKGEAFKQWKKARLTLSDKENILSALKWQKNTDRWRDNGGRYIPNPSTYISQRRWEDEPDLSFDGDITNPDRYTDGDVLPDFIMRGDY